MTFPFFSQTQEIDLMPVWTKEGRIKGDDSTEADSSSSFTDNVSGPSEELPPQVKVIFELYDLDLNLFSRFIDIVVLFNSLRQALQYHHGFRSQWLRTLWTVFIKTSKSFVTQLIKFLSQTKCAA